MAPPTNQAGGNGLKTVAIKVNDELHGQMTAIAQLEEITITELMRQAVVNHLAAKRADGSLAERAQAALDDIDREAASKREAIAAMLGDSGTSTPRGRSRAKASSKGPEASDS